MDNNLPPLTDEEIAEGARPGESWERARMRLERARYPLDPPPCRLCGFGCYTLEEAVRTLCHTCNEALESELIA